MATCMFRGREIGSVPISYTYVIPKGEDDPLSASGHAHADCIGEFQRAQFDYAQMSEDLITQWENELK